MREKIKHQILSLIHTVYEAHKEIKLSFKHKSNEDVLNWLILCQEASANIAGKVEENEEGHAQIIESTEAYCEYLYEISLRLKQIEETDNIDITLNALMKQIEIAVKSIPGKYEIVFFPYKAAMWDSFESIWQCAKEDWNCDCYVIPIPYYECCNNQFNTKKKEYYEGDQFPSYVPITDYRTYQIEERRPDAIYIHNPYDDENSLVTVSPEYFTDRLRKFTSCLVYSPYFIHGVYKPDTSIKQYFSKAHFNANILIAQSELTKEIYIKNGISPLRVMAVGSPKIDYVAQMRKKTFDMPKEWGGKINKDRKVILLNTHLSYFLKAYVQVVERGKSNYALNWFHEMLTELLNNDKYSLIWRPHPFMKQMIINRVGRYPGDLEEIELAIRNSDNSVIDQGADYLPSFYYADAMLSTYSSMIGLFSVTEKPVYIYQSRQEKAVIEASPVDYDSFYYRAGPDNTPFKKFLNYIDKGEDPLKKDRIQMLKKAYPNLDGGAGQKIHQQIVDLLSHAKD